METVIISNKINYQKRFDAYRINISEEYSLRIS